MLPNSCSQTAGDNDANDLKADSPLKVFLRPFSPAPRHYKNRVYRLDYVVFIQQTSDFRDRRNAPNLPVKRSRQRRQVFS